MNWKEILQNFAARSAASDFAIIYATGHGVEVDGIAYLLPGNFTIDEANHVLGGIRVGRLADAGRARRANLVFYGACREFP